MRLIIQPLAENRLKDKRERIKQVIGSAKKIGDEQKQRLDGYEVHCGGRPAFIIFQTSRCASRYVPMSAPGHHRRYGRPTASPARYGTHGVPSSCRTGDGPYSFPAVYPRVTAPG